MHKTKKQKKKSQKNYTKTCHKKKKTKLQSIKKKDINNWLNTKKKRYKMNKFVFSQNKKMSENTLKFDSIKVNEKEFHKSKQSVNLDLINVDQIVVSDKFKYSDDAFKYFTGYKEGEIVKLLCLILPQMSGYIKHFENNGKNMSFMVKDDDVLDKHNELWDKIKD